MKAECLTAGAFVCPRDCEVQSGFELHRNENRMLYLLKIG